MNAFNREQLKSAIYVSIQRVYDAQHAEQNLYRNTLDCFSASIDAMVQGISMEDWLVQERARQTQKTKQNAIGSLHEDIMGSIPGVEALEVGHVFDIISHEKRLIAEVKNKHNTTKGNHKVAIYDDLSEMLKKYPGYTAYYVEVLPKNGQRYDKPFTPSDNKAKAQRAARKDIRQIDGCSFYALLTGCEDAIGELYRELPSVIAEIIKEINGSELDVDAIVSSPVFLELFDKVYGE